MLPIASIFSEESLTSPSSSRMLVYVDDDSESRPADYPADRPQLVLTEDATIAISISCSFLAICIGLCLYYFIRRWKERRGVYFSRELAYSQSSWVPVILTINVDEVLAIELSETGVADCTDVTSGKDKKYIVDPRLLRYAQPLSQSGPSSTRRGKALSRIAAVGIESMATSSSSSLESKASVQDFNGNEINDIKKKANYGEISYDSLEEDPNNSGANSDQSKGQEQEQENENGGEVEGLYHSTFSSSSSSSSSRASFDLEPGLIVSSSTSSSSSSSSSVTESISLSESPRNLSVTSHSKLLLSFSPSSTTSKEEKEEEGDESLSRGRDIVGINNTRRAIRQQQDNDGLQLFSSSSYESKQARSTGVLKTILQEVRYVPVVNIQSPTSVEKKWRRGSIAENMA